MSEIKVPEQLIGKYHIDDNGCWMWDRCKTAAGYATIQINKKRWYVHRLMYQENHGPLLEYLEIDHKCRNRGCINPLHLEQVTKRENIMRGECPSAIQARKIFCRKGHPLTDKGNGHRYCRQCHIEYMTEYNKKVKDSK